MCISKTLARHIYHVSWGGLSGERSLGEANSGEENENKEWTAKQAILKIRSGQLRGRLNSKQALVIRENFQPPHPKRRAYIPLILSH
jgi:hypothetical protein